MSSKKMNIIDDTLRPVDITFFYIWFIYIACLGQVFFSAFYMLCIELTLKNDKLVVTVAESKNSQRTYSERIPM
jgi:hypothetical protein